MVKIREIFSSVQGEGSFVGYKQVFVRFCGCNLNCRFCDTNFLEEEAKEYTAEEVAEIINRNTDCHSVSLTGGEPLLHADFISELATKINLPIYLETNGTLPESLAKVINCITYIAADIKISSCTGMQSFLQIHDKFLETASKKQTFAKVVFDNNITDKEIAEICNLCKKYKIELILQPMMYGKTPSVSADFMQKVLNKSLMIYKNVRLIPQVHKFIDII